MRPPSYYTSLANSNRTPSYSSHSQSSTPTLTSRGSASQLRSSFSNSSSSSYVTRTHLPFVSQSMLVAHCITGSGSTTKPYGGQSASYKPSSSYSSSNYHPTYSASARQHSTNKRPTVTSSSIKNPYLSTSSNYLSPTTTTTSSRYHHSSRPSITSSSYYKPLKLRDRPLLNQISRPIYHTEPKVTHPPRDRLTETEKKEEGSDPKTHEQTQKSREESDWSSDIGRNISRNKYLIKFREIDKPRASIVEPLVQVKQEEDKKVDAMKLPMKLDGVEKENEKVVEKKELKKCDIVGDERTTGSEKEQQVESSETVKLKKKPEKRNIKLRIKNLSDTTTKISNEQQEATANATSETRGEPTKVHLEANKQQVEQKTISENQAKPPTPPTAKSSKVKVKKLTKTNSTVGLVDGEATAREIENGEPKASASVTKRKKKSATPKGSKVEKGADGKAPVRKQSASSDSLVIETPAVVQVAPSVVEPSPESATPTSADLSPNSRAAASKRIRFREYHFEDFNFLSVLGHGGWGFVILAELKEHDACFAVKCIKKITIVEDDDFESIMIERKVLTLGNVHPFICKLFCTFETDGYLFFVMEYCAGGDLMFHVQKEGKFTESRCRFYAAEIICAIRFLHNQHIIYRDLKLDNILLDSSGHVRLVDFGMCQCRTYREEMLPSNFCGTPEYISPEIIKGVPYNHSVDWWSFGVLLYEMAIGKMPFRGNDENELLWNVCYEQIHYPMFLTKELTSLLQLLLEREPSKRMGMATCKAGDIYDQAWFRGLDWRAIEEMRVPPPFVPEVSSKRDVQNFDADFTQSTPELSPVDEATLQRIEQDQFQKFPYTNPNIFIFD